MASVEKQNGLAGGSEANTLEQQLLQMRDLFRHHQNDIRKRYKISANEMEIILFIDEFGPQRMKAIGERFKIKFSTLTSLVDKIERLNLVKRVNSKEDRRSILVTVTKRGKKMLEEYNQQVYDIAERISSEHESDVSALHKILETVNSSAPADPEPSASS